MTDSMDAVLLGLGYPHPQALERLQASTRDLAAGDIRRQMEDFVADISSLELGEWEELHTRTLDLSPLFVPYVGHVVWGESYRRGAFMADLQRAQLDAGVDQQGELPDHLAPILAYLAAVDQPLDDLVEVLPGAVTTMRRELAKSDPDNPYRHVLAAAAAAIDARLAKGASV
jgi:nitrate reductase delta subunit